MVKKLIKLIIALVVLVAVVLAGIHIYFNTGDDSLASQGKAPVQAESSVSADSIDSDLASLLEQQDGAQFSAQIIRTIEDAQDSVKAGKAEAGITYLQRAKDFVIDHLDAIHSLKDVDTGIVEWFVNATPEELLQDI